MPRARLSQIGILARERRGTQSVRSAASDIGVSPATLSRIENGKQPDLWTFERLCRWLAAEPDGISGRGASAHA